MKRLLKINHRPWRIEMRNGTPRINGMTTDKLIRKLERDGDKIGLEQLLQVAAYVTGLKKGKRK